MLPGSASGPIEEHRAEQAPPEANDAYLYNPAHGKEYLTFEEAMNLLNIITGEIMIDGRYGRSQKEPDQYIRETT